MFVCEKCSEETHEIFIHNSKVLCKDCKENCVCKSCLEAMMNSVKVWKAQSYDCDELYNETI